MDLDGLLARRDGRFEMIGVAGSFAPTLEQIKYMHVYIGQKPRLRAWKGLWRCIGRGFDCNGETPIEAYQNWKRWVGVTGESK